MKEINLNKIIENTDFDNELLFDITHDCYGKTMYTEIAMKKAMKEACKQTLELAAENAEAYIARELINPTKPTSMMEFAKIDKQSILNTVNQIK